jgi:hypothetical protein
MICPRCLVTQLNKVQAMNALSRRDNKTYICSQCGGEEAVFDWQQNARKEAESAWLTKEGSNG